MSVGTFGSYVMAVERVERRLREVTAALDAAGVGYAVIGGNAVAAWVSTVDPGATRATKDVGLLVHRDDEPDVSAVMASLGFERKDLRRVLLFIDPEEPAQSSGVHLIWAEELIRPSYHTPAPAADEAVRLRDGFRVLDLPALVRMKLESFRPVDQTHIGDLLSVGLIDDRVRTSLPEVLRERLAQVEAGSWGWEHE